MHQTQQNRPDQQTSDGSHQTNKTSTCPHAIVKKFICYRQHASRSNALFRFKDSSLLTRAKLQKMLRFTLSSLKLPAEQFSTHSLHIGSATAAAEAGVSVRHHTKHNCQCLFVKLGIFPFSCSQSAKQIGLLSPLAILWDNTAPTP